MAFDTVDHQILLSVLSSRFSVTNTALSWFQSYLSNHTQMFRFAGSQSPAIPVDCSIPQGSVLGPLNFSAYTEDDVDLLDQHKVQSHVHPDDTQLYASCRPSDVDILRTHLTHCSADVAQWCASRRLQLNANKTEVIWFGLHMNIKKLCDHELSVRVGPEITPVRAIRDLGVQLDKELSVKAHVAKVSSACYYHLRRLHEIRRRVRAEVTTQLVLALVMSRLDYCNAVLSGVPQSTLATAARPERCSTSGSSAGRRGRSRPRHAKPDGAALAADPLSY